MDSVAGFSVSGLKPRCKLGQFSSAGAGGKSASRLIQVVGRIQFLAIAGLSCGSQLLKAACNRWRLAPFMLKAEMAHCWLLVSLTTPPSFKGLMWLGQAHADNFPFLKVNCAKEHNLIIGVIAYHIYSRGNYIGCVYQPRNLGGRLRILPPTLNISLMLN